MRWRRYSKLTPRVALPKRPDMNLKTKRVVFELAAPQPVLKIKYMRFQVWTTRTRPYISDNGLAISGPKAKPNMKMETTIVCSALTVIERSWTMIGRPGATMVEESGLMRTKEDMANTAFHFLTRGHFLGFS